MATIMARIDEFVRNELEDRDNTRWTDAAMLSFFRQAATRMLSVAQKARLPFARKKLEFTLPASQNFYALPDDFLSPDSLIRSGSSEQVEHVAPIDLDMTIATTVLRFYAIENSQILIKEAPDADTPMIFRYFFDIKPLELLITNETPWEGRLDIPMLDYVRVRALNVDRFDLSPDSGLLNDMEKKVVDMFAYQDPSVYRSRGWLRRTNGIYRRA